MRQFLVNIWAYNHHAKFKVSADDNRESIEKAVLDKIGEKSITWEDLGNSYRDLHSFPTRRSSDLAGHSLATIYF